MTTARHAPTTRPPDLTSVPWDGEHNPGFVQPAGSGPIVLAARPCVTAAPDPAARPVTALGVLRSPGDPAGLTIGLLHLTRYGWHGAGPALPLQDALNGHPYPGVTCPAYPELLRGAARLLDAPDTLESATARARRQAWHAALAEYGDLIGRIGRADTLDVPGVRALYRDLYARAHGQPRPPYPAPTPTTPGTLAEDLLSGVPRGLALTCWAVQDDQITTYTALTVMGVPSDHAILAGALRAVTPGTSVIRTLLPARPAVSAPFPLLAPTVFAVS